MSADLKLSGAIALSGLALALWLGPQDITIGLNAALLVAAMAGAAIIYARDRDTRSVSRLIGVLDAVVRGNLDVDLPPVQGGGQVRRLHAVTAKFRDTARRGRAVTAEREVNTAIADVETAAATPDSETEANGAIVPTICGWTAELERERVRRVMVSLPARLEYRGVAFPGVVLNMSEGGVRFRQDDGRDVPLGAQAGLMVCGMPSVAVHVVGAASGQIVRAHV